MKEVNLDTWADFKNWLPELSTHRQALKEASGSYISEPIFRGQSNSEWSLNSTLERWHKKKMSLTSYYRIIDRIQPHIETVTGKEWESINLDLVKDWQKNAFLLFEETVPYYEYLAYLRHNGFPSPLLDWTLSPYVAAFFSFRKATSEKAERVSIFAFLEYAGYGKNLFSNNPLIFLPGPHIKTHQRHYLQQSRYSICMQKADDEYYFSDYKSTIALNDTHGEKQDVLWKVTMPSKAWQEVHKDLRAYNINPYSLFASEESLMENLTMMEFRKTD